MPSCCDCNQNLEKNSFAKSQLKKPASSRRCLDCAATIAKMVCHKSNCTSILDPNPIQCPGCEQAKYCSKECFDSDQEVHKEECPAVKKNRKAEVCIEAPDLSMEKLGIKGWKDFLTKVPGKDGKELWKCDCCLSGTMSEAACVTHCNGKGHKLVAVKKLYDSGKTFLQYDGSFWKCTLCSTGPMTDLTQEKHLAQSSHRTKEKSWLRAENE